MGFFQRPPLPFFFFRDTRSKSNVPMVAVTSHTFRVQVGHFDDYILVALPLLLLLLVLFILSFSSICRACDTARVLLILFVWEPCEMTLLLSLSVSYTVACGLASTQNLLCWYVILAWVIFARRRYSFFWFSKLDFAPLLLNPKIDSNSKDTLVCFPIIYPIFALFVM